MKFFWMLCVLFIAGCSDGIDYKKDIFMINNVGYTCENGTITNCGMILKDCKDMYGRPFKRIVCANDVHILDIDRLNILE